MESQPRPIVGRRRWWVIALIVLLPAGALTWRRGCRPAVRDWRAGLLSGVDLHRRAEWGAAAPTEHAAPLGIPHTVTVHHSGVERPPDDLPSVRRQLRSIQLYHQKERGWSDVAYHLMVDGAGRLWEGRALDEQGAHAGSATLNAGNLGVVLLGDFDREEPTKEQLDTLRLLVRRAREVCGIPWSRVYGHAGIREAGGMGTTSCPGEHLSRWLAEERGRAR